MDKRRYSAGQAVHHVQAIVAHRIKAIIDECVSGNVNGLTINSVSRWREGLQALIKVARNARGMPQQLAVALTIQGMTDGEKDGGRRGSRLDPPEYTAPD